MLTTLLSLPALAQSALPAPEPTGLVQVWGTLYDQDESDRADTTGYGDPEVDTGVHIRRARVGLVGRGDTVAYAAVVGMSSPFDSLDPMASEQIQVIDAWLGWAPAKSLWIRGGAMKLPQGREQIMSAGDLVLGERAVLSQWLVPQREMGVLLDGTAGPLRYQAGAFNGAVGTHGDTDEGKRVVGRLDLAFGEGEARTFGVQEGLLLAVGADGSMNWQVTTNQMLAGADLLLKSGPVAILLEGRVGQLSPGSTTIDVPGVFDPVTRWGALAQFGATFGAVEPAVRVSTFDDHLEQDDNGDTAEITAGATAHFLEDALRLGGGGVMRIERGGQAVPNDTVRVWTQVKW